MTTGRGIEEQDRSRRSTPNGNKPRGLREVLIWEGGYWDHMGEHINRKTLQPELNNLISWTKKRKKIPPRVFPLDQVYPSQYILDFRPLCHRQVTGYMGCLSARKGYNTQSQTVGMVYDAP